MGAQICAYLTDVEGDLDYFRQYVDLSDVLGWADKQRRRLKFERSDAMFVFGGDSQVCHRLCMKDKGEKFRDA